MCLWPSHSKPKRATKDIVVYKVLCPDPENKAKKKKQKLQSPYRYYTWEINKLETVKSTRITQDTIEPISEGLHAFTTLDGALKEASGWVREAKVYKAIVPKGAYYKLSSAYCGEIASTKMIIKREWKNTNK